MQTLRNWKARRAGGRITIVYRTANGDEAKIVGVDTIEGCGYAGPETGHVAVPVATDKNGERYALA